MEHNEPYIWSLPQEINELIFSNISAAVLLKLRSVSKSVLESLSNQRLWKAACVSEFDLEFIDENANWIKLASKYAAINYNIRKARVLVQALAVNRISSDSMYTGESYILDDRRIVVNWLRTTGRGSGANDNHDHSAILNIETRKEEQSILLGNDRSLLVIGNKLAELDWNGYFVRPFYNNILLSNLDQPDATKFRLPTKDARTVLTNQDPTKTHLVVVFESQTDGIDVHVTLHVHDLNTMQPVKSFSIKNFFKSRHVYSDPNVVFRGNFIYALQSEAKVLHIFKINESAHDVADQIQLDIESTMATLFGVHKSLVFGYCRGNEHSSQRFPWLYDLKAKQLRYYPENLITNMMVHCGVLVVNAKNLLRFIDYRSDPNQLKLISTLQLDEVYRSSLQSRMFITDSLFLSGYNSGAKLIDFEHANDSCEILFVNKTTTQRKKKTISIKAFELASRAKELPGTHEFVSRYFKMSASQRFGIIYLRNQNKNSSIEVSLLHVNALNSKKPEYNTPYMYCTMLHDPMDEKERVVWTVPTPVPKQFYGKVIIFYEEFDGTRWKLSKPKHWITEKTSRNAD